MNTLLSHLGFGRKFALMGLLAALAMLLPGLLYVHEARQTLAFAEREAAGIPVMRSLYVAVRLTQEHRGLSTNALAGNAQAAGPGQPSRPRSMRPWPPWRRPCRPAARMR